VTRVPARPDNSAVHEEWLHKIPLDPSGTREEMGDAATLLASSRASCITGQMLVVDSGLTLL
jgi:enoyl-[acyl-carrier-protein] reductase (NADH)